VCDWTEQNLPPGVILHLRHDGKTVRRIA